MHKEKPMTHRTIQGAAVLIWIISQCISVSPLLMRSGLAGQSADPTVSDLINALQNPDFIVRRGAAGALGRIGAAKTEVVPALINALRDPHPDVRREAAFALEKMGAKAEVIPVLTDALRDPDPYVRSAAAVALVPVNSGQPAAR
jgi:HEAT repeat protein